VARIVLVIAGQQFFNASNLLCRYLLPTWNLLRVFLIGDDPLDLRKQTVWPKVESWELFRMRAWGRIEWHSFRRVFPKGRIIDLSMNSAL
jgi:hypothetical protein